MGKSALVQATGSDYGKYRGGIMADYIIVTVQGVDKIGIVAGVTAKMAQLDVNIEDIKQTIMQDYFVMFLLADIGKSKYSFKEIKDGLMEVANDLKMELWVQKKQIFDKMHTI